MEDLVFRSPLWALLILLIYGVIMSGALWFLLGFVKPSIDRRMKENKSAAVWTAKPVEKGNWKFELAGNVRSGERK